MTNQSLGHLGETIAANFLRCKKGYRIIEKNFRSGRGEVDLICHQGRVVIFVEVKTRTNQRFGRPEEAITPAKLETLERLAQAYCQTMADTRPWKIEVVSILMNIKNQTFTINHLTDL